MLKFSNSHSALSALQLSEVRDVVQVVRQSPGFLDHSALGFHLLRGPMEVSICTPNKVIVYYYFLLKWHQDLRMLYL